MPKTPWVAERRREEIPSLRAVIQCKVRLVVFTKGWHVCPIAHIHQQYEGHAEGSIHEKTKIDHASAFSNGDII